MMNQNSKKVLIIEKQANYTQLLVRQVLFAGLRPIVAVTGEGGLRKALEHRPDLILLELDLTDMDGLEFVSLLKEIPRLQTIPIVAMSIFSYLRTAALFGGCDDFLKKPVKMIDLMSHIRQHLNPTVLLRQDPYRPSPIIRPAKQLR
ncbi:MAG TPA: response regulator [Candidatus Binatia bacterium]|jgi:DNA-binding response OmpR family regulator